MIHITLYQLYHRSWISDKTNVLTNNTIDQYLQDCEAYVRKYDYVILLQKRKDVNVQFSVLLLLFLMIMFMTICIH